MTTVITLPTAANTLALGAAIGAQLRAGDLVILDGALGAGKTVLAQGIGAGMDVQGPITSPTFVIARVHRPRRADGVTLVHVDAYRLAGPWELDDLDLDTDLAGAAVVVEWGVGRADQLADDHLVIRLTRQDDDVRRAELIATGERSEAIAAAVVAQIDAFS